MNNNNAVNNNNNQPLGKLSEWQYNNNNIVWCSMPTLSAF